MKPFILSLAVCSTIVGATQAEARTPQARTKPTQSTIRNATFSVSKMHCQGCVQGVMQAATKWPGVKSANVSLEKKCAVIAYDARVTNPAQIAKGFARIGFPAKIAR